MKLSELKIRGEIHNIGHCRIVVARTIMNNNSNQTPIKRKKINNFLLLMNYLSERPERRQRWQFFRWSACVGGYGLEYGIAVRFSRRIYRFNNKFRSLFRRLTQRQSTSMQNSNNKNSEPKKQCSPRMNFILQAYTHYWHIEIIEMDVYFFLLLFLNSDGAKNIPPFNCY